MLSKSKKVISVTILITMLLISLNSCVIIGGENSAIHASPENTTTIIIQKAFFPDEKKDPNSNVIWKQKTVMNRDDIKALSDKFRNLTMERVFLDNIDQPMGITSAQYVIIFEGAVSHKLIVNETVFFFDKIQYQSDESSFKKIEEIYKSLKYNEEEAKPVF